VSTEHKPHSVQDDILTVQAVLDVYLAQQKLQSPMTGIVVTTGAYINGAMESLAALRRLEEQETALRTSLAEVIEHVESAFPAGTHVDPVFIRARKALDG
jgi:hypothetical protein